MMDYGFKEDRNKLKMSNINTGDLQNITFEEESVDDLLENGNKRGLSH